MKTPNQIAFFIILACLEISCQTDSVLYHSCYQTASSYKLTEWNIDNPKDRFALRETIDNDGRVEKLEFLINQDLAQLCYLPRIVEYEYPPNTIIETFYFEPNEIMISNDCEMYYKTIYHLENNHITSCETFFEIDSINYPQEEVELLKEYVRPYVEYQVNDTINTEVEYYIFSLAKYNGVYPTNKGYIFPIGNYYYDVEPVNSEIKSKLVRGKTDNRK